MPGYHSKFGEQLFMSIVFNLQRQAKAFSTGTSILSYQAL